MAHAGHFRLKTFKRVHSLPRVLLPANILFGRRVGDTRPRARGWEQVRVTGSPQRATKGAAQRRANRLLHHVLELGQMPDVGWRSPPRAR